MKHTCTNCGQTAKFRSSRDSTAFFCGQECFVKGKYDKDKEELVDDTFVYRYVLDADIMDYAFFKKVIEKKDYREIAFNFATAFYYETGENKALLLGFFSRFFKNDASFRMILIRTYLIRYDYAEAYKWFHEISVAGEDLDCFIEIRACWDHSSWRTLTYINTICSRLEKEKVQSYIATKIATNGLKPGFLTQIIDDKDLYWLTLVRIFEGVNLLEDAQVLVDRLNLRLLDKGRALGVMRKIQILRNSSMLKPRETAQLEAMFQKMQLAAQILIK